MALSQGYPSSPEKFYSTHPSEDTTDGDMYLEPSSNPYIPRKARHDHEHDSGVVDLDSLQTDFSPSVSPRTSESNVSNSSLQKPAYNHNNNQVIGVRGMKRPDSLAVKGHEYEELPNSRYVGGGYHYPEVDRTSQRTPPMVTPFSGSKENLCNSQGSNGSVRSERPAPPAYRKRQNPLYEEEQDNMVLRKSKSNECSVCRCPCLAVILFSILSTVTFVLVVLLLVGVITASNSNKESLPSTAASTADHNFSLADYRVLENKYRELLEKVARLEAESQTKHDESARRLNTVEEDISSLQNDVETVSKMPGPRGYNGSRGPQGRPGAGDLSQCAYTSREGSIAAVAQAETPWYPNNQDPQATQRVIMGVECSKLTGFDGTSILDSRVLNGITQYRCLCPALKSPSITSHTCVLHIWDCPKNS